MLYQLRHHRVPTARGLGPLLKFAGDYLVPGLQAAGVEVIGCFTALTGPQPRFSTLLAFADANAWRDQLDAFESSDAWREMEPHLFPDGQALITDCQFGRAHTPMGCIRRRPGARRLPAAEAAGPLMSGVERSSSSRWRNYLRLVLQTRNGSAP